jgi:hypothetical protein
VNRGIVVAAVRALQEAKAGAANPGRIAVGGARELVPLLAKELREGGDHAGVVERFVPDAAAFVWIGKPDTDVLRAASRAHVPIVGVTGGESLPYVLDTNIVELVPGRGLPVEEIAAAIAGVTGRTGAALAARLPVLRPAVVGGLIDATARRNALVGAAVWIPGLDLPILTLNQLRLVFGIATAGGRAVDAGLLPEIAGVAGAAYGWRRLANGLESLPLPRIVVRSGVAFAGTLAVGAAVRRRFS